MIKKENPANHLCLQSPLSSTQVSAVFLVGFDMSLSTVLILRHIPQRSPGLTPSSSCAPTTSPAQTVAARGSLGGVQVTLLAASPCLH